DPRQGGAGADPGRGRPREPQTRPRRADQGLPPARDATGRRGRGIDTDDEAQAQVRGEEVRGADRIDVQRWLRVARSGAVSCGKEIHMMKRTAVALALALSTPLALAQGQGVGKDEIVVGSIQDLSGPLAGFGKQVRLGMMLRVDELNEQGGVNGRKMRLIVEDSGYDPRRAVLAAQKLVNQDKVFAVIGHIGTAPNMAAMPIQFEKN